MRNKEFFFGIHVDSYDVSVSYGLYKDIEDAIKDLDKNDLGFVVDRQWAEDLHCALGLALEEANHETPEEI